MQSSDKAICGLPREISAASASQAKCAWFVGIVTLMGSSLSATQASLLTARLTPGSHVIVMFDEDDAGRDGREDVLRRLALRAFVRVIAFAEEDRHLVSICEESGGQTQRGRRWLHGPG